MPQGSNDALIPYRLRAVRVGLLATMLAVAALVLFREMQPEGVTSPGLFELSVVAAVLGGAVIAVLPWKRLFARGWGVRAMYVWSALDIVLITMILSATGGTNSQLFPLYALTTLFFAISYPLGSQVWLMLLTAAGFLSLPAFDSEPVSGGGIVFKLLALGIIAFMASFLSRQLMESFTLARRNGEESDRRARLLGVAAQAMRSMTRLDPGGVFEVVADSALALGFDATEFCVVDEDGRSYRVVASRNLPRDYTDARHNVDEGMFATVVRRRAVVIVEDYAGWQLGMPRLRTEGFRTVVGCPVWSGTRMAAVLFVGCSERRRLSAEEIEAIELLASQAGRALEIAQRYESERATVERLAELDKLKDDFVSTVSHELRTPLTAIEGLGLTIHQRWHDLDDSTRLELLGRLNANARALHEIIAALLDFSRLESGNTSAAEPVHVETLARSLVERIQPLLDGHRIELDVPQGLFVVADRVMIERVLENLVSNAYKHTPWGTTIRIEARATGGRVTVRISDDGDGIDPKDLPRLGDRFFRGHGQARVPGTGLGLAFVRKVLEQHGAELTISSEVGAGSAFAFSLPAAAPQRARTTA